MERERYQYQDLSEERCIRVLRLQPAAAITDELRASFSETKLDGSLPYEAISYTWGSTANTLTPTIAIDGGLIEITENLSNALKNFRYKDKERTLWADAICINQKNLEEKGPQIGIMNHIYKKAALVLIWLGSGDAETKRSLQGYYMIADELRWRHASSQGMNYSWSNRSLGKDDHPPFEGEWPAEDHTMNLDPTPLVERISKGFLGLAHVHDLVLSNNMNLLYELDWFKRTWTVQEVALASDAVIFYGDRQLEWRSFAGVTALLKAISARGGLLHRNPKALLQAAAVVEARALFHTIEDGGDPKRFADIVEVIRGQRCTQDEDRIYALLNLQPSTTPPLAMVPDCHQPVTHVYLEYAQKSLARGNLEVLYDGGVWYKRTFNVDPGEFLPTWVPDYRIPSPRSRLPWLKHRSCFERAIHGDFVWYGDTNLLAADIVLDVVYYGTIKEVLRVDIPQQQVIIAGNETAFERTCSDVHACRDIFTRRSKERYPTGENLDTAFWNTMVMDDAANIMLGTEIRKEQKSATIKALGNLFLTECMSPDGEVATRGLPDVWMESTEVDTYDELSEQGKAALTYYKNVRETIKGTTFFITDLGTIGLAPPGARVGDMVWITAGAVFPLVLRALTLEDGEPFHILIGPCYVHGMEYGLKNPPEFSKVRVM